MPFQNSQHTKSICLVKFVPALFLMRSFFAWPQDGGTALLAASQYGHMQVVETLLKHGANIHDQLYVSVIQGGFWGTLAHCLSTHSITV